MASEALQHETLFGTVESVTDYGEYFETEPSEATLEHVLGQRALFTLGDEGEEHIIRGYN